MLDPKIATDHVNIFRRRKPILGCQKPLYNQPVTGAGQPGLPAAIYASHFPAFSGSFEPLAPVSRWMPCLRFGRDAGTQFTGYPVSRESLKPYLNFIAVRIT